ncbi:MAG: HlyC/CorC family transporter [Phycisphaerae bacterium]|nr:HlyC/CorC family transporter [Phycisphaerae bacterium]
MTALILYFALALGVSFICSLLEAITLSLTYSYVAALQTKRPRSSALLKQIKGRIGHPLSAILTLNTIANTIGAVGVGAQVVKLWGNTYLAAAAGVLTLMILVFSEIIPKTLGAVYWRKLAPAAAYWIFGLTWLLKYPITFLEIVSRLVVPRGKRTLFSREEMMASVRIGTEEGMLRDQEGKVIQNMLHLRSIRVKNILTPRTVVLALPKHESIAQTVEKHSPIRFSRIPVYGRDLDDIIGVVHRYRLLQLLSEGKGCRELQSIVVPIYAVPDTKSVASALEQFIKRKEHIFLVVDEYGGTAGIVTLEDAIETLLGAEIVDELDKVEDMRKWAVQLSERHKQKRRLES